MILEESMFNFRYVQLYDLDIPREKWLNCLQTVEILIRRRLLWRLIWVCTVCQLPFYGSPNYNGLKGDHSLVQEKIWNCSWTDGSRTCGDCQGQLVYYIQIHELQVHGELSLNIIKHFIITSQQELVHELILHYLIILELKYLIHELVVHKFDVHEWFVLRFYVPVRPTMESCRAWSVYLTTLLLNRLSALSS